MIIIKDVLKLIFLHTSTMKKMNEIEGSQQQDIYTLLYDFFGAISNIAHSQKTFYILSIHVFSRRIVD